MKKLMRNLAMFILTVRGCHGGGCHPRPRRSPDSFH